MWHWREIESAKAKSKCVFLGLLRTGQATTPGRSGEQPERRRAMNPLNLDEVCGYVNETIGEFHQRKSRSLDELKLERLLHKNPYLFRAKNITTANELILGLLDAFLSSSEERLFGDFLEDLAVFVAERTCGGHKSTAPRIDLEFFSVGTHYVVSIKSGWNWAAVQAQRSLGTGRCGWQAAETDDQRLRASARDRPRLPRTPIGAPQPTSFALWRLERVSTRNAASSRKRELPRRPSTSDPWGCPFSAIPGVLFT